MVAGAKLTFDQQLLDVMPQLLEARCLLPAPIPVLELGVGRPPPQAQR